MNPAKLHIILVFVNYVIFLALCAYLIFRAYRHKIKVPWHLFLVFFGIVVINSGITINESFRIGAIWPVLFCLVFLKREDLKEYFIQKKNFFESLLLGLSSGLTLMLFYLFLSKWSMVTIEPISAAPVILYIFRFLEVVIGEEILFRGFIFGELKRQGFTDGLSILMQGFLFFLVHVPRYSEVSELSTLIFVTILGLIGGYITNRTRNISGALLSHAIFNLVPFL